MMTELDRQAVKDNLEGLTQALEEYLTSPYKVPPRFILMSDVSIIGRNLQDLTWSGLTGSFDWGFGK